MIKDATIEVRDLREQDWVWTSTTILFHPNVNGNTYKVYCGLSSYANNHTQKAFPSIATMAKKLHMGKNTVIRGLAVLEEICAVNVDRKEGVHNIYTLLKIAGDTLKKPKKKEIPEEEAKENWVTVILEWAEKRKGAKFAVYGRQVGSLGLMKKAGYTPREISECYLMMEKSEYWKGRGYDFTDVANELPKKIISIRAKNGIPTFEHLARR